MCRPATPASPPPLIRPAVPADAGGLARVHVASWRGAYRGVMPDALLDGLTEDEFAARWKAILAGRGDDERETFVAEAEDGAVAGFASIGASRDDDAREGATGELYALYLHPTYWDRGWGRALWEAARAGLAERGFAGATVWVLERNGRGRHFYERAGFRPDPGVSTTWARDGVELPEVRYRTRLG